jgi:hypothetical protein
VWKKKYIQQPNPDLRSRYQSLNKRSSFYIVEIAPFQIKLSSIHCCEIQIIKPQLSNEGKGKVVSTSVQTAFGTTQLCVVGSLRTGKIGL